MALTNEFIEAVDGGKKIRTRIMLKDIMLVDPTMKQFDEMMAYAVSKMDDLYDEHDGEALKYDASDWNEAYLNSQMVVAVNNFSKERIELLRNIVKHLYRDRAKAIAESKEYKSNGSFTRKQVGIGVTAAGAVMAVAGVCASEGLLIAGGVAIAAVGAVLIVTDKE